MEHSIDVNIIVSQRHGYFRIFVIDLFCYKYSSSIIGKSNIHFKKESE